MSEIIPAHAERLAAIKLAILRLRRDAAHTLWQTGHLLLEVQRDGLWRGDGASSFSAWLQDSFDMPVRTTRIAMRVSEVFSESTAGVYGAARLDAAVSWLEATPRDERPGDLLTARVRIRGPRGTFQSVPFPEATTPQLREATRLLTDGRRRRGPSAVRRDALAELSGIAADRLTLAAGEDGVRVSVRAASIDELRALLAALEAEAPAP